MVRVVVRLLAVLSVLLVAAFLFLRIHGVPAPLLEKIISKVNAAGIRVDVDEVRLTLGGWRAGNVTYYSAHPDDLAPIFQVQRVYFSRGMKLKEDVPSGWRVDIEAEHIQVNPSVKWGLDIPEESSVRQISQMEGTLEFLPGRIEVLGGKMTWLGSRFSINGTILKPQETDAGKRPAKAKKSPPKSLISSEQFQAWENRLQMLDVPGGVEATVDFTIDADKFDQSRFDFTATANNISLRRVGFSHAELAGTYAYPMVMLHQVLMEKGNRSARLNATYDHVSKQLQGSLQNTITSKQLMLLVPDALAERLVALEMRMEKMPRLAVDFGPATVPDVLNHLSGKFSIKSLGYKGLEVESMQGEFERVDERLELSDLNAVVKGQEYRAGETGSSMKGGPVSGDVYWDGHEKEFGLRATTSIDPTLLIPPLSISSMATNILQRFSFRNEAPQIQLEIKSSVVDWSTLYINIRGTGNDLAFQGVELSSLNTVAEYQNKVLRLDPLAATQSGRFAKGSVAIDVARSRAQFDVLTTMHPVDYEDIIYPGLNMFGEKLNSKGNVRMDARGTFDWGSMEDTEFTANVEAERFILPVAETDNFKAAIDGHGSVIQVRNARFGIYGGEGEGTFSMDWNPSRKSIPCQMEASIVNVDFQKLKSFLSKGKSAKVSGTMRGDITLEMDASTNFFSSANGKGFVRVDDGQLADLPLFNGFSRLIRKIIPGFTVFSITKLRGNYTISDGAIASGDAYFEGDIISAKGKGTYHYQDGFNAKLQVQVFRESTLSKVVRAITDPLMRLLEIRLEGTLSNPSWKLDNF
jgi:hypothetical protein